MSRRIFLSYRQKDSAGQAGRVTDRLHKDFGEGCSFLDVDSIPLGANFVKHLTDEVATCEVLLAVIGPLWLDIRDDHNRRRLDDPSDFVRIEISAALQRDIPVIPVLVEGALVPKSDDLPEDIRELAFRIGINVRHSSFHADMDRLVSSLKLVLEMRQPALTQQQATAAEALRRHTEEMQRLKTKAERVRESKEKADPPRFEEAQRRKAKEEQRLEAENERQRKLSEEANRLRSDEEQHNRGERQREAKAEAGRQPVAEEQRRKAEVERQQKEANNEHASDKAAPSGSTHDSRQLASSDSPTTSSLAVRRDVAHELAHRNHRVEKLKTRITLIAIAALVFVPPSVSLLWSRQSTPGPIPSQTQTISPTLTSFPGPFPTGGSFSFGSASLEPGKLNTTREFSIGVSIGVDRLSCDGYVTTSRGFTTGQIYYFPAVHNSQTLQKTISVSETPTQVSFTCTDAANKRETWAADLHF
jgi:flagellar biosynthesis GTPase FlhF